MGWHWNSDKLKAYNRRAKEVLYIMKINVNLKSITKQKKSVKPAVYEIRGCPATVGELILAVTEAGVKEYNERLEHPLLACLTREEIEEKAQGGRIGFGVNYGERKAELKAAQENAIQSFADGIYRIFLDGRPLEKLEDEISLTEESEFTFVRLTMLAGRMW